MRKTISAIAAAATIFVGGTASAATLDSGTYDLSDYDGNRGVWSNALVRGEANKLWTLSESTFVIDDNGVDARAQGVATNLNDAHLSFDFDLSFTRSHDPNPGFCQFDGSHDKNCDSAFTQSLIDGGLVDPSSWDFFNLVSGAFTGNDTMAGLTYDVVDKSGHAPQFGNGANALELGDLGFSMWFTFMRTDNLSNHIGGYDFRSSGSGDFNTDISPAAVPLPAGAALLLGALGALGFVRRKV